MASVELEIDGLRRRYGSVIALDGLSFDGRSILRTGARVKLREVLSR